MLHKLVINSVSIFALIFIIHPAINKPASASEVNDRINDNSNLEISYEDLLNAAIYNNRGGIRKTNEQLNTALQDFNRAIELELNPHVQVQMNLENSEQQATDPAIEAEIDFSQPNIIIAGWFMLSNNNFLKQ